MMDRRGFLRSLPLGALAVVPGGALLERLVYPPVVDLPCEWCEQLGLNGMHWWVRYSQPERYPAGTVARMAKPTPQMVAREPGIMDSWLEHGKDTFLVLVRTSGPLPMKGAGYAFCGPRKGLWKPVSRRPTHGDVRRILRAYERLARQAPKWARTWYAKHPGVNPYPPVSVPDGKL